MITCSVCGDELTAAEVRAVWADTDFIPHWDRGHTIGWEPTPANFAAARTVATVGDGLDRLARVGYVNGWTVGEVRGELGFLVAVADGRLELSPAQACDLIEAAGRERPVIHV